MTAPTEIRKRAIALVEQLPGESLVKAVEFLEALRREANQVSEVTPPEPKEETLLSIIRRRLPSNDQTRLAYLRKLIETGEITEAEYQELLAYVDRVESQDAERAEALLHLARLRNVDLKKLINELLPVHRMPDAV